QALEMAVAAVKLGRRLIPQVEFSAMDAARSDWDYLCRVFEATIDAGATVINIPDTLGYMQPPEFAEMVRYVMEHVPNIDKAAVSVHCHNDLGMATALSLAAIKVGAEWVECTVNGVGERAGNASLEEIDGAQDAGRLLRLRDWHSHRADLAHQPDGLAVYGL